ncbi:MAG: bis(5'-nucleosyl)-tetraphosphatase (symmetrical) YqeK [Dehalococcoidia bacterium]|nr:bis(5'-nucleosyl)-tetraphosphatase (symmetrical) YqeK [Dehalococcoidia bacterium]
MPEKLRKDLRKLPKGLREHCGRVSLISHDLAERHGYCPEKAEAAALLHDIARAMSDEELRILAKKLGFRPDSLEEDWPILIHGPVGAALLRQDYGMVDKEILDAVDCHTTGKPGMGLLDQIIFLADKLDPEKVALFPELIGVRHLAERDLAAATLLYIDRQLSRLNDRDQPVHPRMVAARIDMLARRACDRGY